MKEITDIAFEAADSDGNKSLDQYELSSIMKEVARDMNLTAPSEMDI